MTPSDPLSTVELEALTISQVEARLQACGGGDAAQWSALERDRRAGVRKLAVRARRQHRQREADEARRLRLREIEQSLWGQGINRVAGCDEVGRGCLAGPVVAAAVILPPDTDIPGLDDSKALTPTSRELLSAAVNDRATAVAVAQVEAGEIDRLNILQASMKAMRQAVIGLVPGPERVLVDGNRCPESGFAERAVVGGDSRSVSIAAASVVAKVHRDRLMVGYEAEYPGYGFSGHKGYGSRDHLDAIARLGPCPLHRMSFRPLASDPQVQAGPAGAGDASIGETGESMAAQYLASLGWHILERGYRGGGGEIDLVATDGSCLVFVEVKTARAESLVDPRNRLRPKQRTHLVRAARHYLARRPASGDCRFDVVAVSLYEGQPRLEHLRDAFRAPGT